MYGYTQERTYTSVWIDGQITPTSGGTIPTGTEFTTSVWAKLAAGSYTWVLTGGALQEFEAPYPDWYEFPITYNYDGAGWTFNINGQRSIGGVFVSTGIIHGASIVRPKDYVYPALVTSLASDQYQEVWREIHTSITRGINATDPGDMSFSSYNSLSVNEWSELVFSGPVTPNLESAYEGCTNLATERGGQSEPVILRGDKVELRRMFKNCTSLAALPQIDMTHTPNPPRIDSMFEGCTAMTGEGMSYINQRSDWNLDAGGPSYAFRGCTSLSDYDQLPAGWK